MVDSRYSVAAPEAKRTRLQRCSPRSGGSRATCGADAVRCGGREAARPHPSRIHARQRALHAGTGKSTGDGSARAGDGENMRRLRQRIVVVIIVRPMNSWKPSGSFSRHPTGLRHLARATSLHRCPQHVFGICSPGAPPLGKRTQWPKGDEHGRTLRMPRSLSASRPSRLPTHERAFPPAVHHYGIGLSAGLPSGAYGPWDGVGCHDLREAIGAHAPERCCDGPGAGWPLQLGRPNGEPRHRTFRP